MKILLYSTDNTQVDQFESNFFNRFENSDVTVCRTFERLNMMLRAIYSFSAVVLMVVSKEELLELLTIQKMFGNSKIIVVLPENSSDLSRFALKLYPRYLAEAGENCSAITDVLNKIYTPDNDAEYKTV